MSTFRHALKEGLEAIEVIEQQLPRGYEPRKTDASDDFAGYFIKNGNKTFTWRMHTIPVKEEVCVSFSLVEFHDDQAHSLQISFDATEEKWWAKLSIPHGVDDRDELVHLFSLVPHIQLAMYRQGPVVNFNAEIHDKNAWKLLDQLLAYYA